MTDQNHETYIEHQRPDLFRAIEAVIEAQREATAANMRANMHQCESDFERADAADDARDLARAALCAAVVDAIDGARSAGFMQGRRLGWDEAAADVRRAMDARLKKNPAAE